MILSVGNQLRRWNKWTTNPHLAYLSHRAGISLFADATP
ncbi:hypothetical protein X975_13554, partial [Stegodyphus mimosarum]